MAGACACYLFLFLNMASAMLLCLFGTAADDKAYMGVEAAKIALGEYHRSA